MTRISENLFWDCDGLKRMVIPEGVTSIGAGAFGSCGGLEYIELPESLVFIECDAFSGCGRLAKVRYRDTEDAAFYLEIDGGNAALADAVWRYKAVNPIDGMTNVMRLPAGLKVVEDEAFAGVAAEAVVIPEGTEEIGAKVFAESVTLRYVQIPESVKTIDGNAFFESNITIVCEEDGDIEKWAAEHNLEVAWVE
jgi:hypothetical protein